MPESDGDEMLCHLREHKADPGLIMAKVSVFQNKKKTVSELQIVLITYRVNNWESLRLDKCEWGLSKCSVQISKGQSRLGRWCRS